MKLKSLILPALFASNVIWLGCANNVEIPAVDCSLSDLSIDVVSQVDASCSDPGSITVSASGGTEPYQFSIDGVNFQASATLSGLSAGSYTLVVRDADGCTDEETSNLDGDPNSVSLSIESTDTSCGESSGTITATATGGVPPYSFSLNGGAAQDNGIFEGLSNGENSVTATDGEGCEAGRSVVIESGVSLETTIMPIIASNCAITGCHNGSRSPDLRTSSAIVGNASRIKARTSGGTMPPSGRPSLSQAQIQLISCWVDDGAPNN